MALRALIVGLLIHTMVGSAVAGVAEREKAKRIHDRLIGVPPTPLMLAEMEDEMLANGELAAALLAIDGNPPLLEANPGFYNTVLKNWATPWTNEEQDPFAALNDYSALVIGLIRDEYDFRELLYTDKLYVPQAGYQAASNTNYENLEQTGADLSDPAVLVESTQTSVAAAAGIFTTRAAARAFFVDGTNRAMLRFTLMNHLCMDLEDLKDGSRPTDRIRQDVTRSPGGDSRVFQNNCVECHSGMDPLAQAFAYYEFDYPGDDKDAGQLLYSAGSVQGKYLINSNNFAPGYVTPDDRWTNYWVLGSNAKKVGWKQPASVSAMSEAPAGGHEYYPQGYGAESLGRELADTDAYGLCQVKKAFQAMCLRDPIDGQDNTAVSDALTTFEAAYNMKHVFAELAVYCSGNP